MSLCALKKNSGAGGIGGKLNLKIYFMVYFLI